MQIIDKSNYFKGLLLLVIKDKKVNNEESNLLKKVAKMLGFEKKFYENAIKEILNNEFISQDPPVFSDKKIAECFVIDGLKLAKIDKDLHKSEVEWLEKICKENKIEIDWFRELLKNSFNGNSKISVESIELEKIINVFEKV